jgi:hypothetical protein
VNLSNDKLHVVERFKLLDGGKAMQVNITFEDPDAFNAPWSVMRRYDLVRRPMDEEICAENNQHLFDYYVASKPDFRAKILIYYSGFLLW